MCCMKTNGEKILRNAICVVVYTFGGVFDQANRFKASALRWKKNPSVIANKMPCNRKIKECYSRSKSSFYWDCTFMVCVFSQLKTSFSILHLNATTCATSVRMRILKSDALFRPLNFTNKPDHGAPCNYHSVGLLNQ